MSVSATPGPIWPSASDDCTVGFTVPVSGPIWVRLPTREYARLIAAAPELLAAGKELLDLVEADQPCAEAADDMRAAIAKAKALPTPEEGPA